MIIRKSDLADLAALDFIIKNFLAIGSIPVNMKHFFDCRPLEQACEKIVALVVAMKVAVHVLVNRRQLVGYGFVE